MSEITTQDYGKEPIDKGDRWRKRASEALGQAAGFGVGLTGTLFAAGAWLSSCSTEPQPDSVPGSIAEDFVDDKSAADNFEINLNSSED